MSGILYSSAAAEDSEAVAAGRVRIDEIIATNTSGSTRYLHIFNLAAVPANSTAPDICIAIPSTATVSWDPERAPEFGTGLALALSSTAATLTVTVASEAVFTVRGELV